MTKRLIMILALAFVVGLAVSAYAEVQNVKVSGDLLLRAISRNNFTLSKTGSTYGTKYKVGGLTSTTRLRVDADLTDNVSTTVRLLNERSWGKVGISGLELGIDTDLADDLGLDLGELTSSNEIDIDLAYVTLKEFLYSPLTLTLGRQELRFGNALVIGDPDTNQLSSNIWVPLDLSARKSFDAVRATLNYDPLVVDLIYSKVNENDIWWIPTGSMERVDMDLWGINAAFDLSEKGIKGKLETYLFARFSRLPVASGLKADTCYTVGALFSSQISDNLTGSLEGAYQFGKRAVGAAHWDVNTANDADRNAWALQAMANYDFKAKYAPNLGIGYTYLSGDKKNDDKYTYWDPMFEDQTPNDIVNALFGNSNIHAINVIGSMKPTDDLILGAKYGYYILAQKVDGSVEIFSPYGEGLSFDFETAAGERVVGHALDINATYDYTEDVQFGLTFGLFKPGKAFDRTSDYKFKQTATQLIGSMKVTF